jgi:hypothetical protein
MDKEGDEDNESTAKWTKVLSFIEIKFIFSLEDGQRVN